MVKDETSESQTSLIEELTEEELTLVAGGFIVVMGPSGTTYYMQGGRIIGVDGGGVCQ